MIKNAHRPFLLRKGGAFKDETHPNPPEGRELDYLYLNNKQ